MANITINGVKHTVDSVTTSERGFVNIIYIVIYINSIINLLEDSNAQTVVIHKYTNNI